MASAMEFSEHMRRHGDLRRRKYTRLLRLGLSLQARNKAIAFPNIVMQNT